MENCPSGVSIIIDHILLTTCKSTPFFLNYGYHPQNFWELLIERSTSKVQGLEAWLQSMEKDLQLSRRAVQYAQERMRRQADHHRRDEEFDVGDKVLLRVAKGKIPLLQLPGFSESHKLRAKYVGPYRIIEKVSKLAYRLDLPRHFGAHATFHVDRLKRWATAKRVPTRDIVPTATVSHRGPDVFEVQRILNVRTVQRGTMQRQEYLVLWRGYQPSDATWEPEENLKCPQLLKEFWAQRRSTRSTTQATSRSRRATLRTTS